MYRWNCRKAVGRKDSNERWSESCVEQHLYLLTLFLVVAPGSVVVEKRVHDGDLSIFLVKAAASLAGVAVIEQAPVDEHIGIFDLAGFI